MNRPTRSSPFALAGLLAAACTYVDTDRPSPPVLDDPPASVKGTSVDLAGFAEPGSTVSIARDPGFEAAVAPVKASDFTGAFRFDGLPLVRGAANRFTFTCADPAGNASESVSVTVESDDRPDGVSIQLLRDVVVAGATGGEGDLVAIAELEDDSGGLALGERTVTFVLGGLSTESIEATTDGEGRAQATFTGLTTPGLGTVTARVGNSTGTPSSRPASFRVVAGPVSALTLSLAPAGTTTGTGNLSVTAGAEVDVLASAADGSGNALEVPIRVSTNAPGATVLGRRISGLSKAGTYEVVASVDGLPSSSGSPVARATLVVVAGPLARVRASAPVSAVAGEPFAFVSSLEDAGGNAVSLPTAGTFVLETTLPAETYDVDLARNAVTVRRAGTHRFTATVTGAGTVTPGEFTIEVRPASPGQVDVALSGTDTDPTTPAVLDVVASASATIGVSLVARDEFGNAVAAPVVATVNGGVLFDGAVLRRLTVAGDYELAASVPGSLAGGSAAFKVRPAAPAALVLSLDRAVAAAGETVRVVAGARDPFGNTTTEPSELVVDGLAADRYTASLAQGTLVVRGAGNHVVRLRSTRTGTGVPAAVTTTLAVAPAAPASAVLSITPSNDVRAGEQADVALVVRDAFTNTVANPPVRWTVVPLAGTVLDVAPPVVSGGKVLGLVRPGTFRVSATVEGTSVTTDPAAPEGEIRVTAARATSIVLQVSPEVLQLGGHTSVTTALRDAYGNAAAGTVTVQVLSGPTVVAGAVGATFTPPAAGTYSVVANATLPNAEPAPPQAVRALSVLPRPDAVAPTITFHRPAGDPTITAWPPPGAVTPNRCATNAGDVVSVTFADGSAVTDLGLRFDGLATQQPPDSELPSLAYPATPVQRSATLCTADVTASPRGEVLVSAYAVDTAGNLAVGRGSWCIDPGASEFAPVSGDVRRCATARGATLDGVRALAADGAGDLAVVTDAGADATVTLYTRTGQPYGLGTPHALPAGLGAPRQAAFAGRTAFVPLADAARSVVVRTRALDVSGAGFDDEFAVHASATERLSGVVLAGAAEAYATVVPRDPAAAGGRVVRLTGAFDFSSRHASLPTTPVVASTTARPDVLCAGASPRELFAAGWVLQGSDRRAALFRIDLDAVPVELLPAWVDTETNRAVTGCARVAGAVAVAIEGATSAQVSLVDLASASLAAPALLTGFGAAPEAALATARGLAVAGGYLFFASDDGTAGSLVRFARDGGF